MRLRYLIGGMLLVFLAAGLTLSAPQPYSGTSGPIMRAEALDSLRAKAGQDSILKARQDSLATASARQDDSLAVRMQRAARDSAEAYADDAVDAAREIAGDSAQAALVLAKAAIRDSLNADTLRFIWLRILPADSSASGTAEPGIAGETLTFGQAVYFSSDGKWYKTDADTSSTMPCAGVVVTKGSSSANAVITVLKSGFVRCDAWNWTVSNISGKIYPSTSAGTFQQTAVSGTSDVLQIVGYARTADVIYFWPSYNTVQIK